MNSYNNCSVLPPFKWICIITIILFEETEQNTNIFILNIRIFQFFRALDKYYVTDKVKKNVDIAEQFIHGETVKARI